MRKNLTRYQRRLDTMLHTWFCAGLDPIQNPWMYLHVLYFFLNSLVPMSIWQGQTKGHLEACSVITQCRWLKTAMKEISTLFPRLWPIVLPTIVFYRRNKSSVHDTKLSRVHSYVTRNEATVWERRTLCAGVWWLHIWVWATPTNCQNLRWLQKCLLDWGVLATLIHQMPWNLIVTVLMLALAKAKDPWTVINCSFLCFTGKRIRSLHR